MVHMMCQHFGRNVFAEALYIQKGLKNNEQKCRKEVNYQSAVNSLIFLLVFSERTGGNLLSGGLLLPLDVI